MSPRCGGEFLVANFVRTKFSSGCELLICAPNRSQEATIWQLQVRGSEMTGTARGISEEITRTSGHLMRLRCVFGRFWTHFSEF